ncbi:mannosyltransferase [Tulasnella sp. UAMH 9824]|nr:mannosyltransferase [Tulasnella sp. UAMH 9824]
MTCAKLTIISWNIVGGNIFHWSSAGPELYGTSLGTPTFQRDALLQIFLPLVLLSLSYLLVTSFVEYKRLGPRPMGHVQRKFPANVVDDTPGTILLVVGYFADSQERFIFPTYPLLCFKAAVIRYLIRGWTEVARIKATSSPYKNIELPRLLNFKNLLISPNRAAAVDDGKKWVSTSKYEDEREEVTCPL